eukprot:g23748.t1
MGTGKAVICMDTMEIFPSISQAAIAKGIKPGRLANAIQMGHKSRGLKFMLLEDENLVIRFDDDAVETPQEA